MSGVTVGTHLERLYALRDRIIVEIRTEERRVAQQPTGFEVYRRPRPKDSPEKTLEDLHVTSRQVKQWALDTGLIEEIKRGRVSTVLVNAYAQAHPGGTP